MEAVSKKGKIFRGKLAKLMVKVGVATPLKNELTAKQVAEKIALIDTMEQLKQYESDNRQIVKNAYNKKLKELN